MGKTGTGAVRISRFDQNNITLASGTLGPLKVDAGHPAVFQDENPAAADDAKYKAFVRSSGPNGLLPFKSADGLHWSPMTDAPILSGLGAFDSQNLAFWDPTLGQYRAYWRIFSEGIRGIRTATSSDFIHWGKHHDLTYVDSPPEHLYTNQIKPYHRAPHILIGFPTRYNDRGWTQSTQDLPELEHRKMRSSAVQRYGNVVTEGLVMSSRDGRKFNRWNEAFLRPGPERPGTWNYGHQYIAWQLVETKSALAGAANELSLYAGESYWTGKGSALRRYTLRLDGFVSVHASMQGGELLTKPFVFAGGKLSLNFASSGAGGIRVELQRPDGSPLPGHALADADVLYGDSVDRTVSWKGSHDVQSLAGQPLQLRFELQDADLYSLQFS